MKSFDVNDEELYEHFRLTVDPKQSPIRIDRFLIDRMEKVSRNRIQQGIKAGAILVNSKNIKSNYKVRPGDLITVVLANPPELGRVVTPEAIELEIVFEDEDIIILNKQAGMVVHPGIANYSGTLVNALVYYLQQNKLPVMEGNQVDRPGLVHRLDKDTSGLMLVAKNDYAMTHLAKQFFDHSIERHYEAIVWGAPNPSEGTIEENIGRNPRQRILMTTFPEGDEGKTAITHYKTIEDLYYVSLVQCSLETGRTHQIRVHMMSIGHPVFNDLKYGGNTVVKGTVFTKYKQFVQNCFSQLPRQALHAKTIGFRHPQTNEHMFFESALPSDMQIVLEKWRNYIATRKR